MDVEEVTMPESEARSDAIEEANSLFWKAPSLEELMAGVAPLRADESFEIEDMTDEEWQIFVDALDE
jgi:hypothetical protein